ncbi:MAG: hypothetical protein HQK50_05635 [Oligoflexia bacterium]|nr:hypothetical protein [Oligoflexia bacterium]
MLKSNQFFKKNLLAILLLIPILIISSDRNFASDTIREETIAPVSCTNQQLNSCINNIITKLNVVIQENNTLKQKMQATNIYSVSPDTPTETPTKDGAWSVIDGMVKEIDLTMPSKVLIFYSLTVSAIESAVAGWVATRLLINNNPVMTSGRVVQLHPGSILEDSTDTLLAAQEMQLLPAGHHKIELQWRATGCKWKQWASAWYGHGGLGGRTLSIVVLPAP